MTSRDFDAWAEERRAATPALPPIHDFTLGGQEFHLLNPVPIVPVLHKARMDDSTESWLYFLENVIVETGIRLEVALAAAKADEEFIRELGQWALEVGTNRPTQRPSVSRASRSRTGARSKAASPSRASTPKRSARVVSLSSSTPSRSNRGSARTA